MCGWPNLVSGQSYTPRFCVCQQKMHQAIEPSSAVSRYHPTLEAEMSGFVLFLILRAPHNWLQHTRTQTGAIILKMTRLHHRSERPRSHGRACRSGNGTVFSGSHSGSMDGGYSASVTLPDRVAARGWIKKAAKEWHRTLIETTERPMQFVRMQLAREVAKSAL